MAGRHDSIMVRISRSLHGRLKGIGKSLEWARENMGRDYPLGRRGSEVALDGIIEELVKRWESHKERRIRHKAKQKGSGG